MTACGNASQATGGPQSTLLVIGDSWVSGGPMNSGPTWPHLIELPDDWTVSTDALGGSGYIGDEDLSLTSDGRLDRVLDGPAPEVVVVAMGRNDVQYEPDDVVRVARTDLLAIEEAWPGAEVVVFSPFSPERPEVWTVELSDSLERLAGSLGMSYLDVSDIVRGRSRFIEDWHPNDAGHALIAKKVTSGLRDLEVVPPD